MKKLLNIFFLLALCMTSVSNGLVVQAEEFENEDPVVEVEEVVEEKDHQFDDIFTTIHSNVTTWIEDTEKLQEYYESICTITYANTDFESATVMKGEFLPLPYVEMYGNEDQVFDGWYKDEELTEKVDFLTVVEGDMTIYPKYRSYYYIDLRNTSNYTFVSQVKPNVVRMGCEASSLLMALKSTGHIQNMKYKTWLELFPKTDTNNPYFGFAGSLYEDSDMVDAAMPNVVADFGALYGNTKDISKLGIQPVIEALANGHPVVVWTSVHMKPSESVWYDTELLDVPYDEFGFDWHGSTATHWEYKTNNHVMTLLGYDEAKGYFLVGDPAEWADATYWVRSDIFHNSWDCYQGAVEVW